MAALVLAAAPAQATVHDSLTVRATASVRVGQVLTVSGTATHPRSVEVERLVGHRWRPLARAHATGGRAYSIALRAPSRPTTWQLRVGNRRLSVHVVARAWSITAVTAPLLASPGRIAVTGTVSPRATGVVWLQREVAGGWHDLGTAVLHADSTYLVHTAGTPGTYRLRVRKAASSRVAAGFSAASTVVVQVPVTTPVVTNVAPANNNVVRAWGANTSGQLGNGSTSEDPDPTQAVVAGTAGAVAVTAGDDDGYALRFDGSVLAWGDGSYGQLGDGALDARPIAAVVPGLSGVVAVSASAETVLALRSDGTVWAWGSGDQGELGSGTTDDSNVPREVPGLQGITAIASAASTGYALRSDGTIWAWGDNGYGQVGDGTTGTDLSPVQVVGIDHVTHIAAGTGNGYALRSDGTVWAWGTNTYGDLGNGDQLGDDSSVPVQVTGVVGATDVAGGNRGGYAVVAGGAVLAWGDNEAGQLDVGDPGIFDVTPASMTGLTAVTALAADGLDSFALSAGSVLVTGDNGEGQLGNGDLTVTGSPTPQPVAGITGALAVAAGLQDGYAITSG